MVQDHSCFIAVYACIHVRSVDNRYRQIEENVAATVALYVELFCCEYAACLHSSSKRCEYRFIFYLDVLAILSPCARGLWVPYIEVCCNALLPLFVPGYPGAWYYVLVPGTPTPGYQGTWYHAPCTRYPPYILQVAVILLKL